MVGWLGMPGEGMGGMYGSRLVRAWRDALGRCLYGLRRSLYGPGGDAHPGLVDQERHEPLVGPNARPQFVDTQLVNENQALSGTLTNKLDFPLSGCLLAYDRWAYDLGELKPGHPIEITSSTRRVELQTLVTGRKFTAAGDQQWKQGETAYDSSNQNAAYVLQAMTFYDATDGRRHTHLSNDYQHFVDLSGQLKAGQAVLIAQAPDRKLRALGPNCSATASRSPAHRISIRLFCVFVFPVK